MRKFVVGDIHGAYRALVQCLERSEFSTDRDILICLGDICDSWPEVNLVFDALQQIKSLVLLLGNHDLWALDWFKHGRAPDIWLIQGGAATRESYPEGIPKNHIAMLDHAEPYYILEGRLFVHGGIATDEPVESQSRQTLLWDRSLVNQALSYYQAGSERNLTGFTEVFVGHTPTLKYGQTEPIKACEVIMMDTGAGWPGGVLSMMDIESREVFQSDPVDGLYPGVNCRA